MSKFSNTVMEAIRKAVADQFGGNVSRASQAWGVTGDNLHKWLRGDRIPTLEKISPIMDRLGSFVTELEASKDVCFVNAKVVPAGEKVRPPRSEDYIAAPLVGEVGAGPGFVAQDDVESWFLVYKHVPAIRQRSDLIAVEIGPQSTSMSPLLNPGDIVLVDRGDRRIEKSGHIMLVRDPDGAGMIKRVALNRNNGGWIIQFYSDNAAENPPMIYNLDEDFTLENAIVGRVIWAWTDVRGK